MKNLITFIFLILLATATQAQVAPSLSSFTPTQQNQLRAYVKYTIDSSNKKVREEIKTWTDNKRTIDSTQNMKLKSDSSDLVTLKEQVGYLIKELSEYQFIEVQKLTPEEQAAFNSYMDKIKNLALLLNGKTQ